MYFSELLESDAERASYNATLVEFGRIVRDAISLLIKAWHIAEHGAAPEQKYHHASVLALARHGCEMLDGVSVLAEKGAAEPCKPALRSAFEVMIGIEFILESDEERRGLSYQVAHAHRKIGLYRRFDPNDNAGKQLARDLADDPLASNLELPDVDIPKMIANLEGMLCKPEYAPIEAEWARHDREPAWYSLFDGPKSIRQLAFRLKHGGLYEFLYRHWSNSVHAGDCLEAFGPSGDGVVTIRPIRHPESLQELVCVGVSICIRIGRQLVERYGSTPQIEALQHEYVSTIRDRHQRLREGDIFTINWH